MQGGMSGWVPFMVVRARLALAIMVNGSCVSRPCEAIPFALVNRICCLLSSFRAMTFAWMAGVRVMFAYDNGVCCVIWLRLVDDWGWGKVVVVASVSGFLV